jgi:hypothetical protein
MINILPPGSGPEPAQHPRSPQKMAVRTVPRDRGTQGQQKNCLHKYSEDWDQEVRCDNMGFFTMEPRSTPNLVSKSSIFGRLGAKKPALTHDPWRAAAPQIPLFSSRGCPVPQIQPPHKKRGLAGRQNPTWGIWEQAAPNASSIGTSVS